MVEEEAMVDAGGGITTRAKDTVADVEEGPETTTTDQEETLTRATGPAVDEVEVRAVTLPATGLLRTTTADMAIVVRRGVEATTLFQVVLVVEGVGTATDTRVTVSTMPRLLPQFKLPMARITRVHLTAVLPAAVLGVTVAMEATVPAVAEAGTEVKVEDTAGMAPLPLPPQRLGLGTAPLPQLLLPLAMAVTVTAQPPAMVIHNRDTNLAEARPITARGDEVGAGKPLVLCKVLKLRFGFL